MNILRTEAVADEAWNDLVAASDDAWLYHSKAWLDMTARVYNLENVFFSVTHNGALVGAFAAQLQKGRLYGREHNVAHANIMGPAGPLFHRVLEPKVRQRAALELTQAIREWLLESHILHISCSLPPLAPFNLGNVRGVNPLSLAGWKDVSTHTRIIDLSATEDVLWANLSRNAHRKIRAAEKVNYRIQVEPWQEALEEYYDVHVQNYTRTGVPPHRRSYFEGIAHDIAPDGAAVLWVARDARGQAVAFHNDARFGSGSLSWTACSRNKHLEGGINYLLFWESLKGARRDGCRWYDANELFLDAEDGKLRDLTTFKSKFGGETYRFYRGTLAGVPFVKSSLPRRTAAKIYRGLKSLRQR